MDYGRLTQLMQRYNQLGRLLNDEPDVDDATQVAEAKIILDEMEKTKAEIDAMLPDPLMALARKARRR
jgi:hypothetical protein